MRIVNVNGSPQREKTSDEKRTVLNFYYWILLPAPAIPKGSLLTRGRRWIVEEAGRVIVICSLCPFYVYEYPASGMETWREFLCHHDRNSMAERASSRWARASSKFKPINYANCELLINHSGKFIFNSIPFAVACACSMNRLRTGKASSWNLINSINKIMGCWNFTTRLVYFNSFFISRARTPVHYSLGGMAEMRLKIGFASERNWIINKKERAAASTICDAGDAWESEAGGKEKFAVSHIA